MMIPVPGSRGHSLLELMCSLTIGSILLLGVVVLLKGSGAGYERVGASVAADREARAMMSRLAADLTTSTYHKDWVIEQRAAPWATDRLGFLNLQMAQAQTDAGCIGDLCAVYYYIKDLSIGGKTVRCLMRGCRESLETFTALEHHTMNDVFSERILIDEPIAFGVVSFEARPKSRDRSARWIDWVKNDLTGPEAFAIRLVVARRELTRKLKQADAWDGAGGLLGQPGEADRNAHLAVYSTLIQLTDHANP